MFFEPLKLALIVFPLLSLFLITPYIIFEYRKRGAVNVWRTFVIFMFIYYLISAYFLVILPLPDPDTVTNNYQDMMQLRPFQFLADIAKETVFVYKDRSTYLPALTQPVVTQVIFNVLLTLPFGVFLHYYFKRSIGQVFIATFLLSLFFEVSQLTGLFFIYPGPYRLFDVDDLMLNTIGGLVGYGLAPILEYFVPSREEIDEKTASQAAYVSIFKRFIMFIIDLFIIRIVATVFSLVTNITIHPFLLMGLWYFLWTFLKGTTPAGWFFKVKIVAKTDDRTSGPLLLRSLIMSGFYYFNRNLFSLINLVLEQSTGRTMLMIVLMMLAIYLVFMGVYLISLLFEKDAVLFYDRLSGVKVVSVFHQEEVIL